MSEASVAGCTPSLIKLLVPRLILPKTGPGTAKTSLPCSAAWPAVIKEGVHPATEAPDILQILDIKKQESRIRGMSQEKPQDKNQAKILSILDEGSKHIDVIARESGLSIDKVSSTLSLMELSGFIKNYGSGIWGI